MGSIIGKYEEPAFQMLLKRVDVTTPYEIRRYGQRFAVEAEYVGGASPFPLLAGYIGVLSKPQNEGKAKIDMTVPVAMKGESGTKIAMTAPVAMHEMGERKMQFILPSEYNELEKIPKPTNPNVKVTQLTPAVGAVHRYSGFLDRSKSKQMASKLVTQLREDGVFSTEEISDAVARYQYWRFNPPFSLPFLSRNEVWVELSQEQVDVLADKFSTCIPSN